LAARRVFRRLGRRRPAALAELMALVLTAAVTGTPDDLPWLWMFAAFTTRKAAMLTLPETRIPASPASMVPSGAIRSISPPALPGSG
jgi:hypothetical protein